MIELLVVVAIIALLISILLPSLSKAREMAKGVTCMSNLKQVNYGFIMFANEHDGNLPSLNDPTVVGPPYIGWFGGHNSGTGEFFPELGLLAPYWGDAKVGGCPSFDFTEKSRPQYGPTDYAYSNVLGRRADYNPPLGTKLVAVQSPTETVMTFDSARVNNWHYDPGQLDRTPWGYAPTWGRPSFHGRHSGNGNVGWVDGHVSPFAPVWFDIYSSYNGDELKSFNVGDIDRDGDPMTDELFDLE